MSSCAAVRHGSPSATELPKKISENDSPTIARMPQRANRLRRVLARRAAAEVGVHEQHRRAGVARIVERMRAAVRLGCAVVLEQVLLEPLERDDLQEPRRDDAIGVDVVAAQRQAACR